MYREVKSLISSHKTPLWKDNKTHMGVFCFSIRGSHSILFHVIFTPLIDVLLTFLEVLGFQTLLKTFALGKNVKQTSGDWWKLCRKY